MTARRRAAAERPRVDRVRFGRWVGELVANVTARNLLTQEFRAEYVKAANPYKRVAEYDPDLASELFFSAMMLSYTFAVGVTKKIFAK